MNQYQGPKTINIYQGDASVAAHPDYVKWLEERADLVQAASTVMQARKTTDNEGYPPDWVKLDLMVSPDGTFHAVGGAGEEAEGDAISPGLERLHNRLGRELDAVKKDRNEAQGKLQAAEDRIKELEIESGELKSQLASLKAELEQATTPSPTPVTTVKPEPKKGK